MLAFPLVSRSNRPDLPEAVKNGRETGIFYGTVSSIQGSHARRTILGLVVGGVLFPFAAAAPCGDGDRGVGAFGTGGESSDGKAQGWHQERPSTLFLGETYTNVGNDRAGRIAVSDTGTIQGMAQGDVMIGHTSGAFGTASGQF